MTGDDVPNDEMPNILRPGRRDPLPLSDAALEALLAGTELPAELAPQLQPVADVLAVLRADPASRELAGQASALAEFRRAPGAAAPPRRPRHRRPHVLPAWAAGRAAAAMGVAALGLGGLVAAAFTGVLPAPVQRLAHNTFDAPPATSSPGRVSPQTHHAQRNHPDHRKAPDSAAPTSPAAPWACNAYMSAWAHGSRVQLAIAAHDLIRDAHGAGKVTAYCGRVKPLPGWPARHTGKWVWPSRDRRFLHHRDGQGRPPGEQSAQGTPPGEQSAQGRPPAEQNTQGNPTGGRRGHRGPHRNGKQRAHWTGWWGQNPPLPATVRGAYMTPHVTELFPARS